MTIMKKSIICLVSLLGLALGFTSCEKPLSGEKTSITYYAEIVLKGDASMVVAKGSAFVDPGFTATMKGEDVTDKVTVESNVDTSTSGIYSVVYSIVNADGFPASASRTVIVLDVTDPVEGIWKVDVSKSYRIFNGSAPAAYKGAFEFLIIKRADGKYDVEDLMAGWYAQGAGYGDDYAMNGVVDIAGDGTITLVSSKVKGWGDSADDLKNGKFTAADNNIYYELYYGAPDNDIQFYVSIDKVEL